MIPGWYIALNTVYYCAFRFLDDCFRVPFRSHFPRQLSDKQSIHILFVVRMLSEISPPPPPPSPCLPSANSSSPGTLSWSWSILWSSGACRTPSGTAAWWGCGIDATGERSSVYGFTYRRDNTMIFWTLGRKSSLVLRRSNQVCALDRKQCPFTAVGRE